MCTRQEPTETSTSGGVNVAATHNSISWSCSDAFGALGDLSGTRSCSLKSDLDLESRNVTENSRIRSENRSETMGYARTDENQATQTFAEQLSRNFIDSVPVH